MLTFGQRSDGLAQWLLRDGYVATRATVVKAPLRADAIEAKSDQSDAIAGWHVEPTIPWESFLSRERWPEKYTPKDFVKDNLVATMVIAIALLLAVIWLLPLGGRRVA